MCAFKFIDWTKSLALGHVVLFGVPFLVAESLVFSVLSYLDHGLTAFSLLKIFLVAGSMGVLGALAVWYVITLPRIKRDRRGGKMPGQRN